MWPESHCHQKPLRNDLKRWLHLEDQMPDDIKTSSIDRYVKASRRIKRCCLPRAFQSSSRSHMSNGVTKRCPSCQIELVSITYLNSPIGPGTNHFRTLFKKRFERRIHGQNVGANSPPCIGTTIKWYISSINRCWINT